MARLVYSLIASLDGYIEDVHGRFDWAAPGAEAHAFVNDLERPVGTYLYGRGMYETMAVWETDPSLAEHSPEMRDFAAIWKAADKIVYSSTLPEVSTSRTVLERRFDPDAVRRLKAAAAADMAVAGPGLAAHAFRAGLVDELHVFLAPALVGAGKRGFPADVRLDLDLIDERRFADGMAFLRYRVARATT
ncbi:MAG TPA: dihydrofolate reductase family protein [Thermoleophilaceae bacterium]|nr:dihydrofolate reductase family protein [Thermoleophilaceae bacterium]